MTHLKHLLIVDDDARLRHLISQYLRGEGYLVTVAQSAHEARLLFKSFQFDLAVLDIMMPGESGLELLSDIRTASDIPVFLLSARGLTHDRIEGLKKGADDYLAKPFEPEELALRIAALIRRSPTSEADQTEQIHMSGRCFDLKSGLLTGPDGHIPLTETETKLLSLLAGNPGKALRRDYLAEQSSGLERSIDVQVTRLRKKIEPSPKTPIHIQTVRGIGYKLMTDAA